MLKMPEIFNFQSSFLLASFNVVLFEKCLTLCQSCYFISVALRKITADTLYILVYFCVEAIFHMKTYGI